MAKVTHTDNADALLNNIKNNGDKLAFCEGQPTSYADAFTNKGSGGKRLVDADANLAYTGPAAGDAGGNSRKLTVDAVTGETVDVSGDADHVAIGDSINSKLLIVTTATLQTLTAGNTVNSNAWDIEVSDIS